MIGDPACMKSSERIPRAFSILLYVPKATALRDVAGFNVLCVSTGTMPVTASQVVGGVGIPA